MDFWNARVRRLNTPFHFVSYAQNDTSRMLRGGGLLAFDIGTPLMMMVNRTGFSKAAGPQYDLIRWIPSMSGFPSR